MSTRAASDAAAGAGAARRAAREAAAKRRTRTASAAREPRAAAKAASSTWQRILREDARAARVHRDGVRAALHELDRHLDMGDELTRRLTLFPGCPVH